MKLDDFNWVCRTYITAQQPFYDIEDDELLEYTEHGNHQDAFRPVPTDINDMDISCITNRKGLKILHLNINGLLHKLDYVKMLADKIKFDVLSSNQTKLDGSIGDKDIEIPGYTTYRKDRNKYGGGVLLYIVDSIESYPITELQHTEFEVVWTKICFKRTKPIIIGSLYRPPRRQNVLGNMKDLQKYLTETKSKLGQGHKEIHLFGDFNCDMLRVNGLSSAIKEICNAISASQLIEEPTRITDRSSTLTDLLISTAEDKITESGVIHTAISDHSMIYAIRKCRRDRNPPRIINTRSYKTFNPEKFTEDLQSADWSGIYTADNIHKATEAFTEQVQIIADKHAPRVTVRVKEAVNNIFSDELLVLR